MTEDNKLEIVITAPTHRKAEGKGDDEVGAD